MSLGIAYDNNEIRCICKKIVDRGIIIVAAFDNAGSISYPAAYPFVLGVDASAKCVRNEDFIFVKNSPVNLMAKGGVQRLAWKNNSYVLAQGASFAAAHISAYIIEHYEEILKSGDTARDYLEKHAKEILECKVSTEREDNNSCREIKNAAVFPFNKEIEGIVNFSDLLPFHLEEIYDIKLSRNIGKEVCNLSRKNTYHIKSVEELDGSKIDTLIVGHLRDIEMLTKRPIKRFLLERCLDLKINVFMFDEYEYEAFKDRFKNLDLELNYAKNTSCNHDMNRFGKMYNVSTPVLGVFGTSSKQGKFTLQMELRRRFLNDGYRVEQLITEPSATLFKLASYPFGYLSSENRDISPYEKLLHLNDCLHHLDLKRPDIILVGSQSGTVPQLFNNLGQYTIEQIIFLLGTLPDGIVLCVNYGDDLHYVRRTVQAIESFAESKVLLIAIYPKYYDNGWHFANGHQATADSESADKYADILRNSLEIPVFVLNSADKYDAIYQKCIESLSEN